MSESCILKLPRTLTIAYYVKMHHTLGAITTPGFNFLKFAGWGTMLQ